MGTHLKPSPTRRGPKPDIEVLIGLFLKIALVSCMASFGLTILPFKSLAYCCTNYRYSVIGLSTTAWKAEPLK